MTRPTTGPYRKGNFRMPEFRGCDRCHRQAERATGTYVKTSALRQVWCCERCLTKISQKNAMGKERKDMQ